MKHVKPIALALSLAFALPLGARADEPGGDESNCDNLCSCVVTQNWGNGAYYDWAVYKRGKHVASSSEPVRGERQARKACRDWTLTKETCFK